MGEESTDPVRIGIVGAGNRGRNHANRYGRIPGAEVVAVADVDEAKARALADAHGAESYSDHESMLESADVDAVNVCVHATLHADLAVDALEAGTDVFCEKPMADSYAAARRMFDAAERTGNRLGVQNQLLYTKETRAARSLVEAGELGDVYHGVAARSRGHIFAGGGDPEDDRLGARRRGTPYVDGYGSPAFVREESAGGGAVLDLGSYTVGQLLYLMGSPTAESSVGESSTAEPSAVEPSAVELSAVEPPTVERVRGVTYQTMPDRVAPDSSYADRIEESGYDVEDVGLAFVTFADDAVLSVRTSWSRYAEDESSAVVGTRGGVRLDPFEYVSTVAGVEMRADADLDEYLFRQQYLDGERGRVAYETGIWADPLYHWIETLRGRTGPLPTAELALESMVVLEGIYRSAELGREVTREEVVETARESQQ
jgi:predicted dehydrogenase